MNNINAKTFINFDATRVPSPCFVIDEIAIENNLKVLKRIQDESGAKILLALKAFSMFSLAPLISRYLQGVCASGIHEARLGAEFFKGEVHTYSAAFNETDLAAVLAISNHVVFNSFGQWQRFQALIQVAKNENPSLSFGLRINPRHSEGTTEIYDPCAQGSRLGIPVSAFNNQDLTGIDGLHFHTLCEQGFEPLDRTLAVIEEQFADVLPSLKWVNFGGGHLISDPDYNVDALIQRVKAFQEKYQLQVYLEPGEAIAIRSGVLVSEVLDIMHYDESLVVLDTSATCHMPDTLEMPYRAEIFNAAEANVFPHTYRLGGQSCLAGDRMGEYSFNKPLRLGERIVFDDMAHYTMVKTTTFNGIQLPTIAIWNSETDEIKIIKQFTYEDFKNRLS